MDLSEIILLRITDTLLRPSFWDGHLCVNHFALSLFSDTAGMHLHGKTLSEAYVQGQNGQMSCHRQHSIVILLLQCFRARATGRFDPHYTIPKTVVKLNMRSLAGEQSQKF